MEKLEAKRIYLTGSRKTVERVVWKDNDGRYWIRWGGEMVQVYHPDGYVNVTAGWRTVEDY